MCKINIGGIRNMNDYEICPTCGASLDIGEKCSFCKPLITPIPKQVSRVISKSTIISFKRKKGVNHATSECQRQTIHLY